MHGHATDVVALQLDLAGVDGGANLDAHGGRDPTDLLCRTDGSFGAIEERHEPVAGGRHLPATEPVELIPHLTIVPRQQVAPRAVAELVHTEQHRRLNERTRLDEVARAGAIEFSRPTYYGELLALIQAHAYDLSEVRGEFVWLPGAARDWDAASWLPALEAIEANGLKRAYDFKTHGDLYLWTSQKLRELRTTDPIATWTEAAALLARVPVDRTHRRESGSRPSQATAEARRHGLRQRRVDATRRISELTGDCSIEARAEP